MGVCDPFRHNFETHLIQDFTRNFDVLSDDTWFVGIGRPAQWIDEDGNTIDDAPPANSDSIKSATDFWRGALAFKKIQPADVSLVVTRRDWALGNVYDAYRDTSSLFDDRHPAKFYVLVDDERVYKCIDNAGGVPSNVAPTHTDHQIRKLADGYRWQYMYTISESKRKFLTNGSLGIDGYMPVEFVEKVGINDDRIGQLENQNSAISGSIDFIALNPQLVPLIVPARTLFIEESPNYVAVSASAGATTVYITSPNLDPAQNAYQNMVFKVVAGPGIGQQRTITGYSVNYNPTSSSQIGAITIYPALNYGLSANSSTFAILPNVMVVGDGSAAPNILNTYSTGAELEAVFTGTGSNRHLSSLEIINPGKDYTYADIRVIVGLTMAGVSGGFDHFATAIVSPVGGNASNPVTELGSDGFMISMSFSQSESSKITVANDYRQFCLIRNPCLAKPQVRVNLITPGLTGSFTVGNTITQGLTTAYGTTSSALAYGTIVSWRPGVLGTTGTSELRLTNVTGNFVLGGILNGLTANTITRMYSRSIAGTEGRLLRTLKLVPPSGGSFDPNGNDFIRNYTAVEIGNTGNNITPGFATGTIYNWQPALGNNSLGTLSLENPQGSFQITGCIAQIGTNLQLNSTAIGRIIEVDEASILDQTVYSQAYQVKVAYDGTQLFNNGSFVPDTKVSGANGSGYVVDWTPLTTTAGTLSVLGITGVLKVSDNLIYTNSNLTGASVTSVLSTPELLYHSGEIMHLQNVRPITRSIEQSEEIKLVVEF